MIRFLRRISFAAGLALLVGGWGATQYAKKQQEHVSPDQRLDTWGAEIVRYREKPHSISQTNWVLLRRLSPKFKLTPSSTIYRNGVISMAGGAFLVGLVLLRDGKNSGVELAPNQQSAKGSYGLGVLRWIGIVLLSFIAASFIATFISLCRGEIPLVFFATPILAASAAEPSIDVCFSPGGGCTQRS